MPAHFVSGDLFASPHLVAVAHGCNCAGAMGKGIALEFKRRFPAMFKEYRTRCRDGRFALGDVFVWDASRPIVFNLATQRTWRTKAELDVVRISLHQMISEAEHRGLDHVGLPRIGAGLGGLDWPSIREEIAKLGTRTSVALVVVEDFQRNHPVGVEFC